MENKSILRELEMNLFIFKNVLKQQKQELFEQKVFLFLGNEKRENPKIELLISFLSKAIYFLEEVINIIEDILLSLKEKRYEEGLIELKKFIQLLEENKADNNLVFQKIKQAENYLEKISKFAES